MIFFYTFLIFYNSCECNIYWGDIILSFLYFLYKAIEYYIKQKWKVCFVKVLMIIRKISAMSQFKLKWKEFYLINNLCCYVKQFFYQTFDWDYWLSTVILRLFLTSDISLILLTFLDLPNIFILTYPTKFNPTHSCSTVDIRLYFILGFFYIFSVTR